MSISKGWLEKRRFERVKDVLKVAYYRIKDPEVALSDDYKDTTIEKLSKGGNSPVIQAITEDISEGGLSIITNENLAAGEKIVIDLFLPRVSNPVRILAEIKHVEAALKTAASYRAGLSIISISKSDINKIEARVNETKNR